MKATIDIKTPAGQSLEGFPQLFNNVHEDFEPHYDTSISYWDEKTGNWINRQLHVGDTITIKIEE